MMLIFLMLLGVIMLPAAAATTSSTARIYPDFTASPAYQKYSEFASLYVSQYSAPIPGLEHTDVNGTDCTTMVPQGICFAKDYMIVSAYDSEGKCNSVLYVLSNSDGKTRTHLMTLVLPVKAHIGGVAFDGTYLWVSNGKNASSIKYTTLVSTVQTAVAGNKKSVAVDFYATCATATTASFLTYSDGMIWAGEFKEKGDSSGRMYSYVISSDGKKLTRKYHMTLPDRIQGACFKNGYLILSRSDSRNISSSGYISELRIYKYSKPDSDGSIAKNSVVKVVDLPPMVVGVVTGSTYLYSLYESAATQYYTGTDGNGICKYPVDRIVAFQLADLLPAEPPTEPELDSVYFPCCDAGINRFADALVSTGYDFSKTTREAIATANGIPSYTGMAQENETLLALMKAGKLINPGIEVLVDEPMTVALDQTSITVPLGRTVQLSAIFGQGTVTWKSSNLRVATVSVTDTHSASITAASLGKATITCTLSNGKYAKCVINVEAEYFASCDESTTSWTDVLSDQGFALNMETRTRIAEANGISDYSGTAAEDDALLSLLKDGNLINPGLSLVASPLARVSLDKTNANATVGQQMYLAASFMEGTVTWKTSNTKVVTVTVVDSDTVLLNAVGEGKATVTCMLDNGSFAKCVVIISAVGTSENIYFPKCGSAYDSIVLALESIGVDSSKEHRAKIAAANGIDNYEYTAEQNTQLLDLLKAGKLINPDAQTSDKPNTDTELGTGQYLVTFDANSGTGTMANAVLNSGDRLPVNAFTKKGYQFQGWALTATGSVAHADGAAVSLTSNLTLYAVWKPITYIVTYDANGGTGTMENTIITYGVSTTIRSPGFTRAGYTLTGWYRYRTSDNKWIYTSPDGTNEWYEEGTQPSGYNKNVMSTTASISKTSSLQDDVIILYAVWAEGENTNSLDGKNVMFIGNSFIYYGGVVNYGSPKKTDKGWFYDICKANGESVTVYDCTYGAHRLRDFTSSGCKNGSCHSGKDLLSGLDLKSIDYLFISEAGENNANFVRDVKNVIKRFPSKTKVFYLSHSYTYIKNHTNITKKLSEVQKLGVGVIEWGKLVDDVIDGRTSVSGATVSYKKNTFIKNKGDTHHPNPLAGYITAQMAYCAATGKTAVGQMPNIYAAGDSNKYGQSVVGYSAFTSKHYTSSSSSNYKTILKSSKDILGLQKLMNKYLAKRDLGVDAK